MHKVDVRFRLIGDEIPADHGYHLFAAISRLVPSLHGDDEVGVHPISGRLAGNRRLALTDRSSLTIRLASDRVGEILPLAGKTLQVAEDRVRVGVPRAVALQPRARLYSRLVIIKGYTSREPFLEAVQSQLDELGIRGEPSLVAQPQLVTANQGRPGGTRSPYLRRTIRIRDKEIVGFALRVAGLSDEDSIALQETGLGGRRRFGCGIFLPAKTEGATP